MIVVPSDQDQSRELWGRDWTKIGPIGIAHAQFVLSWMIALSPHQKIKLVTIQ